MDKYNADIVVMTIIPGLELRAIRSAMRHQWSQAQEMRIEDNVYKYEFTNSKGLNLVAAVKAIYHAGNLESALETTTMLSRFRPTLALLCGIAGNIRHDKARLGDVIVSGSYAFKQYTRMSEGKHLEATNQPVPMISRTMQNMAQRVFSEVNVDFSGPDLPQYINGHHEIPTPTATVGKIFCWDLVLDCNETRLELIKEDREYRAVEMEAAGFLKSIDMFKRFIEPRRPLDGLIFRGLSDPASGKALADEDPDIKWRPYAARNAARAMTTFVDQLTEQDMGNI